MNLDNATVHYNINSAKSGGPVWTIRKNNKKVRMANYVVMHNCKPHVGQAGALAIANGANKSVHAWIRGDIAFVCNDTGYNRPNGGELVGYNPRDRKETSFNYRADGAEWRGGPVAYFMPDGQMVVKERALCGRCTEPCEGATDETGETMCNDCI
tara:strand:- start:639 stop:1103 length:465 start_codon:yes stop_codon:yes gene_type:complete